MALLAFLLECYFAVMLAVSGLIKINDATSFEKTLQQQHLLPTWSTKAFSKIFPWIEISIAFLLIAGVIAIAAAFLLLALFVAFLGVKVFLLATKNTADCGCTGRVKAQKVDGASVTVSVILVLIAAFHLWLVFQYSPINWIWRSIALVLLVGVEGFLLIKTVMKHTYHKNSLAEQSSALREGQPAPPFVALDQTKQAVRLNDYRGRKLLLTFVAPGCPACSGALVALQQMAQEHQDIMGIAVSSAEYETNHAYATEQGIHLPFLTLDSEVVAEVYHPNQIPYTLVIDETGIIRAMGIANRIEHFQTLLHIAK